MAQRVLILNPKAGGEGVADQVIDQARRRLGAVVRPTQETGDAAKLAKSAVEDGAELVLAAGGDGTINEVVNGMVRGCGEGECRPHQIPTALGVVPMGTANDFVRTLGLPADPMQAIEVAATGQGQWLDLIRMTGQDSEGSQAPVRYLINAATGGFSRVAAGETTDVSKHWWGPLSYMHGALRAMPHIPEFEVELWCDGAEQSERVTTCAVILANGRYAGGGYELAPRADPTDHHLELLAVTAATFLDRLKLTGRYMLGDHIHSDAVLYRSVTKVKIHSDPALKFSSDGEPVGQTPVTFEVAPAAISVVLAEGQATASQ